MGRSSHALLGQQRRHGPLHRRRLAAAGWPERQSFPAHQRVWRRGARESRDRRTHGGGAGNLPEQHLVIRIAISRVRHPARRVTRTGPLFTRIEFDRDVPVLGNLINGTSSRITTAAPVSYGSLAEFPLDAPNGRLIVNYPPSFGQSRIAPLDVTSGTLGPALADSTIGTPSFGTLSAMALDNVPGGTTRLLAVDASGVFAVDLATGTRSVVSSTSIGGGTPPVGAYGLAVDSATRRAWAVSRFRRRRAMARLGER